MKFVQKLVVLALTVSFLSVPVLRASADESAMERTPSAAKKHHGKHKGKKKSKKARGHSKRKGKHAKSGTSGKTHYPTQPGGTGLDVPSEKKDDLPPPQGAEPTPAPSH